MAEDYILSDGEKRALRDEKSELENTLKLAQSGEYGKGTRAQVDENYLKNKIKHLDSELIKGSAKNLRGGDKDRLASEAKDLAERMREGMPTRDEMLRPEKNPGAVMKHVNWDKRNKQNIQRWKQINRQLNPDDPTTSNIEKLRRN